MSDYIKISRKMLDWEWYLNINTKVLFIHMLLKANWKECKFEGTTVPRGSFVSSIRKLSEETGLTEREVRTSISHLKTTHELTCYSMQKYTVFTVVNYDVYQSCDKQNDTRATHERQTNDKLTTTIEEKKEIKKGRNNNTLCKADAFALFERLWQLYPCKKGKGQVSDAKKMRLLDIGFDEMSRAIERYMAELKKDDWRKPQNGSTFFNSGYVDYLDANYVPTSGKQQGSKSILKNQFNQFPQRDYDFDELEKDLLSN